MRARATQTCLETAVSEALPALGALSRLLCLENAGKVSLVFSAFLSSFFFFSVVVVASAMGVSTPSVSFLSANRRAKSSRKEKKLADECPLLEKKGSEARRLQMTE